MSSGTGYLSFLVGRYIKGIGMSMEEIEATSNTLVVDGTETTATLLSATIYYLMKPPVR
jgi:cytochrome P450